MVDRGKQERDLKNKCVEIQASPRMPEVLPDGSENTVKGKSEDSKSLPGLERYFLRSIPSRLIHSEGISKAKEDTSKVFKINEDLPKPQMHLKQLQNRRAISVHEDQLRNHSFTTELEKSEKCDIKEKPDSTEPAQVLMSEGIVAQSPVETVQNAATYQRTAIKPSKPSSESN